METVILKKRKEKEIRDGASTVLYTVYIAYIVYTVYAVHTVYTIQTAFYNASTYCSLKGRLKRYWNGLLGFWAECWMEWMDGTPKTVMTTLAPAVLRYNQYSNATSQIDSGIDGC